MMGWNSLWDVNIGPPLTSVQLGFLLTYLFIFIFFTSDRLGF